MKKVRSFLRPTIWVSLLSFMLLPAALWAQQSRIPRDNGGTAYLMVTGDGNIGDTDEVNVVFFQVPASVTGPIYFAIYDGGDDTINEAVGDEEDNPAGTGDTVFRLLGGTGALTGPEAKTISFTDAEKTAGTPYGGVTTVGNSGSEGTLLGVLTETGDATVGLQEGGWDYFPAVSPSDGERVGNSYVFRIVVVGEDTVEKNGYRLDVSGSDNGTGAPSFVTGARAFAYTWTLGINDSGTTYQLFPFVPEGTTGNVETYSFDFDAGGQDPTGNSELFAFDPATDTINGTAEDTSVNISGQGSSRTYDNLDATSGEDLIERDASAIDIATPQVNGTWLYEFTEFFDAVDPNPGEIWFGQGATAGNGINTLPTIFRTYSDQYFPADPDHVSLTADDLVVRVDGTDNEVLYLQLVDVNGNAVPYVRSIDVTLNDGASGGGDDYAVITASSDPAATIAAGGQSATVSTNVDGLVTITLQGNNNGAGDVSVNLSTPALTNTVANDNPTLLVRAGTPPTLSSADDQNIDFNTGGASDLGLEETITITEEESNTISTTADLRIKLPPELNLGFDGTAPTIGGTASAKVAGSSFESSGESLAANDVLILDVSAQLNIGETITVSGLALQNGGETGSGQLTLSYDGGTTYPVADPENIFVVDSGANIWYGNVDTDWETPNNWSRGTVPVNGENVVIRDADQQPVMTATVPATGALGNLRIEPGATVDLAGNALSVTTVENRGTIFAQGGEAVTINGNTGNAINSFDIDSGTVNYTSGYTGALAFGTDYFDLTVSSGTALQPNANLNVYNDLRVPGVLDASATPIDITIGGDFLEPGTGTFTPGTTVIFQDPGGGATTTAVSIDPGTGATFNNVVINDGGGGVSYTLGAPLTANADLTVTSGTLDLNGTASAVTGNVTIQAAGVIDDTAGTPGTLSVDGNWTNSAGAAGYAAQGTVRFLDNAVTSVIAGNTTFYNFSVPNTVGAKTIQFTAGSRQTLAAGGSFSVLGTSGNLVVLQSTASGTQWELDVQGGTSTVDYADISDSDLIGADPAGSIAPTNSVDSGGNDRNNALGVTFDDPADDGAYWAFPVTNYSWDNGGAGSSWGTAANWNPDGVPGTTDTATIPNGFGHVVDLDADRSVSSLTTGADATVRFNSFDFSITGTLTNEGTLQFRTDEVFSIQGNSPPLAADFDTTSGTVEYVGLLGANAWASLPAGTTYFNLTFNDTADADDTWTSGATVNGALTVSSGTYATGDADLTVAGATSIATTLNASGQTTTTSDFNGGVSGAGTLSTAPNGMTVAGGLTVTTLTANGPVTIDGAGDLALPAGYTIGNLIFAAGAGNVIASQGPLTVTTGLTLTSGTWNAGTFTHTVAGNWDSSLADFVFTESTSTINLTAAPPTITTGGAPDAFHNLNLPNGASATTDLTVTNQTTAQGTVGATAAVTLDLGALVMSGALSASSNGGTITAGSVDGAFDLLLPAGAGNTTVTGAIGGGGAIGDGVGPAVTTNSTGTTAFQGALTTASGITQAGTAGTVTLGGNADIGAGDTATTFNGNVVLDGLLFSSDGAVTFGDAAADTLTLQTGDVTIETTGAGDTLTVNAATDGPRDLILNIADATTFAAAVGAAGAGTEIGDATGRAITINSPGATTFQSTLETRSGIYQAGTAGTVTFQAGVTAAAGDTDSAFDGSVILDGITFTGGGGITFGSDGADALTLQTGAVTLQPAGALTVNAATDGGVDLILDAGGATTLNGTVGFTTPLGSGAGAAITLNSAGTTDFANTVATNSGILQADGAGEVTFRLDLTLGFTGASPVGSTFNGNVVLDGMVVNSDGELIFGNAAADTLTASLNTVQITTPDLPVTFNAATTLSGASLSVNTGANLGDITFNGSVDGVTPNGNKNLTLAAGTGTVVFNGAVGATDPVGTTPASGAAITVSSGTSVEFAGTLSTNSGLAITPAVTFRDTATIGAGDTATTLDGTVALDGLTMSAGRTINFGNGAGDTVTLSSGPVSVETTANDGDLVFADTINGSQDLSLTTNGAGRVILNGDVTVGANAATALVIDAGGLDLASGVDLNTSLVPGDITLTVDSLTLAGTNTIDAGTATVQLTPRTPVFSVEFGDADTALVTDVFYDSSWTGITAGSFIVGDGTTPHSGDITLTGTTAAPYALSVLNGGTGAILVTADYGSSGDLTLDSGSGEIAVAGITMDIGTGLLSMADPITLTGGGSTTMNADGGIQLQSTVDATSPGVEDLALEAVGANITVVGPLGGSRLGALSVADGANVGFTNAVTAASFTQSADSTGTGTTTFSGVQDYTGNFSFTGSALTVNNTMSVGGSTTITNGGLFTKNGTGAISSTGGFTQNGGGVSSIGANISTTNTGLSFATDVTLTGTVQLSTDSGLGNISLGGVVNETTSGTEGLTFLAGTGDISVTGSVGSTELGALQVSSANDASFNGAVAATSFTQLAGGGTTTFAGVQTYSGNFDYTGAALTVNNGMSVSGTTTIDNSGLFAKNATGTIAATGGLSQVGTGGNAIAANISATDSLISFATLISLGADVTVAAGAGAITLGSTVDADAAANLRNLSLNSSGTTTVVGPVGGTQPLASLTTDANGTTVLGAVTTRGNQTYGDPITLNATAYSTDDNSAGGTFGANGASVTIANNLSISTGPGNLTVLGTIDADAAANNRTVQLNSSGITSVVGATGGSQRLASLTTDAGGTSALGSVTTSGNQTYNDPVTLNGTAYDTSASAGSFTVLNGSATTLGASTTITTGGGAITFTGTVDAATAGIQVLTLSTGAGSASFQGAVGTTALGGFSVQTGTADLLGNPLSVDGSISIQDTLDANSGGPGSSNQIQLTGNWTNTGTFNAQDSVVLFNGLGTSTVNPNGVSGAFHDLTVDSGTTVDVVTTQLNVSNTLTLPTAADTIDLNNQSFTIDTLANSGTFRLDGTQGTQNIVTTTPAPPTAGTVVYYNGAADGSVRIPVPIFDLEINAPGRTIVLVTDLRLHGSITITDGTFRGSDGNGRTLSLAGSFSRAPAGVFEANDGTVSFFDEGVVSDINGGNTFFNFVADVGLEPTLVIGGAGKVIRFQAGTTTSIATGGTFRILGDNGNAPPGGDSDADGIADAEDPDNFNQQSYPPGYAPTSYITLVSTNFNPAGDADRWTLSIPGGATLDATYADIWFSIASPALNVPADAYVHFSVDWLRAIYITESFTRDRDFNGKIDTIEAVVPVNLDDVYTGMEIVVNGYTVTGIDTGSGVRDRAFWIHLEEKATLDTDARPTWYIADSGLLRDDAVGLYEVDNQPPKGENNPEVPYDDANPVVAYTLARTGGSEIFVQFSEPVYDDGGGSVTAANFAYDGGGTVTGVTPVTQDGSGGYEELLLILDTPVSADEVTNQTTVRFLNGIGDQASNAFAPINPPWADEPVTPNALVARPVYASPVPPDPPAAADPDQVHRVSDLVLVDPEYQVVTPVFARELNTIRDPERGGLGLVRTFDGSEFLRPRDILIQSFADQSVAGVVPGDLRLFYDSGVATDLIRNQLWLPPYDESSFSGLVPGPNGGALSGGTPGVSGNLVEFTLSPNSKLRDGVILDFFLRVSAGPPVLYAARLSNHRASDWYRNARPFSFEVAEIIEQRGSVTILSNVINPENGDRTTLTFELDRAGMVSINVFTLAGDLVDVLQRERLEAGEHSTTWDGTNLQGRIVTPGIYFIRVVGPGMDEFRKVMVID